MYSYTQSLRIQGEQGKPLNSPWKTLPFQFCRGQTILVCAAPGIGKSLFAANLAIQSGEPTLYFSADSDPVTQTGRAWKIAGGRDYPDNVMLDFDPTPGLADIDESVEAYVELQGEAPALVVYDNLTDIDADDEEDLNRVLGYLNESTRLTQACTLVLHHVTGQYNDGVTPVPLSGVKEQVGRIPQAILTLYRPAPNQMGVCKVKDRNGQADPSAANPHILRFSEDTLRIEDYER